MFANPGISLSNSLTDPFIPQPPGSFEKCSLASDANLLAHYRLEDTSNRVSTSNYLANSNITFSAGKWNNAADFGTDNNTTTKRRYLFTDGFGIDDTDIISVAGWVYFYSVGLTAQVPFQHTSKTSAFYFQFYWNGTNFSFDAAGSATTFNPSPADPSGVWHHFAFTRNHNINATFYWDNVSMGTISTGTTPTVKAGIFYMGFGSDNTAPFLGLLDDVVVFNRLLTSTDVGNIFNGT